MTAIRPRVLLVGDGFGVPQSLRALPDGSVIGIIAASNRPQYHDELRHIAAVQDVPLLIQPAWGSAGYGDFHQAVAQLRPDLIFCNSYSMLVRDDVLALAPRGGVNVHPGKVPDYRGPNPIQWSIINDERDAGVTIHHMTAEIDAGDVIAATTVPIRFYDRWHDVASLLAEATEHLLREALPSILGGTATARPQPPARNRWPRRRPDDSRIDWNAKVLANYNFVRALGAGIPPAFYDDRGTRIVLDRLVSLSEITCLTFAPGPGGRSLRAGDTMLIPIHPATPSDLVRFTVMRSERTVGECALRDFDPDSRTASTWVGCDDACARDLLFDFAVGDLGLTPSAR